MLSRKHRRTLVLSLLLSAGALALPAQAAPSRSHHPNAGSAVQTDLFTQGRTSRSAPGERPEEAQQRGGIGNVPGRQSSPGTLIAGRAGSPERGPVF